MSLFSNSWDFRFADYEQMEDYPDISQPFSFANDVEKKEEECKCSGYTLLHFGHKRKCKSYRER